MLLIFGVNKGNSWSFLEFWRGWGLRGGGGGLARCQGTVWQMWGRGSKVPRKVKDSELDDEMLVFRQHWHLTVIMQNVSSVRIRNFLIYQLQNLSWQCVWLLLQVICFIYMTLCAYGMQSLTVFREQHSDSGFQVTRFHTWLSKGGVFSPWIE